MYHARQPENVSNKIRAIKDSRPQHGGTCAFVRSFVRFAGSHARFYLEWVRNGKSKNVIIFDKTYERERRQDERELKGGRRRRFGIYTDRCPTVNRPISEGAGARFAGQSLPLFFRRASLDRRLVFRILYYTVLSGPSVPSPGPSIRISGLVGEALRVNRVRRTREDAKDKRGEKRTSENSREKSKRMIGGEAEY